MLRLIGIDVGVFVGVVVISDSGEMAGLEGVFKGGVAVDVTRVSDAVT
jgi:hypothetical protein